MDNQCVVRLARTYTSTKYGCRMYLTLNTLKRLTKGFNLLCEDVSSVGAEEVMGRITNLNEVDDGVYRLVPINESRDFETGHIDDYDYALLPLEE